MSVVANSAAEVVASTVGSPASTNTVGTVSSAIMRGAITAIVRTGTLAYVGVKLISDEVERQISITNARIDRAKTPLDFSQYASSVKNQIMADNTFLKKTANLTNDQQEKLAGLLASQGSPLGTFFAENITQNSGLSFNTILTNSTNQYASANYSATSQLLEKAAHQFGFTIPDVVRSSENSKVIVYQQPNSEKKLTVVVTKNTKTGASSMALDVHGYDCNSEECVDVMENIEMYLKENGLEFSFSKVRHRQPAGVLLHQMKKKIAEAKQNMSSHVKTPQHIAKKVIQKIKQ